MVHPCFAAANRDPARWDRPDEFDPGRAPQPHLAFGNGPHVCLGMHVARAEIDTAVRALIARLPNLRLDGDAEPPRIIGMYERGPSRGAGRLGLSESDRIRRVPLGRGP